MGIEDDIKSMWHDIAEIHRDLNILIRIEKKLDLLLNKEEPQDRTKIEKDTKDALKLNDSVEVSTDLEA